MVVNTSSPWYFMFSMSFLSFSIALELWNLSKCLNHFLTSLKKSSPPMLNHVAFGSLKAYSYQIHSSWQCTIYVDTCKLSLCHQVRLVTQWNIYFFIYNIRNLMKSCFLSWQYIFFTFERRIKICDTLGETFPINV
jgi:hypothetical protein